MADAAGKFHWGYPGVYVLCSECGSAMYPESNFSVRPFLYIVYCANKTCSQFEVRYRVAREQGIRLERV